MYVGPILVEEKSNSRIVISNKTVFLHLFYLITRSNLPARYIALKIFIKLYKVIIIVLQEIWLMNTL